MPAPHPSVEAMHGRHSSTNARLEDVGGVEQQLEPADGGAAAWKVLCATFVFEAVLFGEHRLTLACARKTLAGRYLLITHALLNWIQDFPCPLVFFRITT